MKKLFTGLCMSWGNFCFIPGLKRWNENARNYMLGWLPTVGVAIGICWGLCYFLMLMLGIPAIAAGVILAWIPFLASGFMHADGFMDCSDALLCRGDLDKKRSILKDSHIGGFAVICLFFLILTDFGFICSAFVSGIDFINLVIIAVISRSVSALCVLHGKAMPTSQYAKSAASDDSLTSDTIYYNENTEKTEDSVSESSEDSVSESSEDSVSESSGDDFEDNIISVTGDELPASKKKATLLLLVQLVVYLAVCALLLTYYLGSLFVLVGTAIGTLLPILIAKKQLGGVSGDIAGYGICWGELFGIVCLVFC